MHSLLQEALSQCNDTQKRMLIVLGHPGSGKSTLISYILNNCTISSDRSVHVYRISSLDVDWQKKTENIPQLILNALAIEKEDLSDSVLILDGLDEIDMQDRQADFLKYLYKQWAGLKKIRRFSLFVTCRRNRIENLYELSAPHIELSPLSEEQIIEFAESYQIAKGEDLDSSIWSAFFDESENLSTVIDIPLILYMTLALGIKVDKGSTLCEVYNQIFSLTNANSIYYRKKYDHAHEITSNEAEKIHEFSKQVAIAIWSNNPYEATVPKSCYEVLAEDIVEGKNKLRNLLIGQYFIEGGGGAELYFVHRSMYEYFVALRYLMKLVVCKL